MAVLLFTAPGAFDGNLWETLRQYVAGISTAWPDLGERWAEFSDCLSQPRKPVPCGYYSPVRLNDRQMSWRLSLPGGSHSPLSVQYFCHSGLALQA